MPSLECTIADSSGQLTLVFQGRRHVPGIEPGARLVVEGMVGQRGHEQVMVNPLYWIVSTRDEARASGTGRRSRHRRLSLAEAR